MTEPSSQRTPARLLAAARTWQARHPHLSAVAFAGLPALAWLALVWPAHRWPSQDGPHVLGIAGRLAKLVRDGELLEFGWSLGLLLAPHPPGAYLPATAAYAVVGPGPGVHLLAGALALALCVDGLRRLGAGPVGLLWLAGMPLVWQQVENYGVDFLAAACVVQSISHLAASERLARRRSAAAWGAWMGAAFMVKYTAPVFLIGPCLVAGLWVLRGRRWRALLVAFAAFAVVALPWYLSQLPQVHAYLAHTGTAAEQFAYDTDVRTDPWGSWANLSWYPAALREGWGDLGLAALVLGVLAPPRRGQAWSTRVALILGVAVGWFALSHQIIRETRYFLPGIVLLVALAGSARLRWLWVLPAAVGAWFAAGTYASTDEVPPQRAYHVSWEEAGDDWPAVAQPYAPVSAPPARWKLFEALDALRRHVGSDSGTVGVLLDERAGGPQVRSVLYASTLAGYRWHVASPSFAPGTDPVFVAPFATDDWPTRDFDVLLAILGPGSVQQQAWLRDQRMERVEAWEVGGGLTGAVYVRPGAR